MAFRKAGTTAKLALVILHRDTMGFFQPQLSHGWLETDMIDAILTTTGNKYMLYCKMGVTVACCPESIIYVEHFVLPHKKEFYQSNFLVCAFAPNT